jgi:hypothetical protein
MDKQNVIKVIAILALVLSAVYVSAQTPPHPNGGAAPATGIGGNTPVGAGAPVGSGTLLLLGLAGLYGGKKVYAMRKSLQA